MFEINLGETGDSHQYLCLPVLRHEACRTPTRTAVNGQGIGDCPWFPKNVAVKRRLTKLVVFLLLGAIVNVAVAWGCALARPFPGDSWSDTLAAATGLYEPVATAWHWDDILSVDGRGVGWETRCLDFLSERDDSVRRISDEPPPRILASVNLPGESTDVFVVYSAAGWPFEVLNGAAVLDYDVDVEPYPALETWWCLLMPFGPTSGLWPVVPASEIHVGLASGYQIVVPLRPIWPGVAINTLFYAAILWLLTLGPFTARRMIRRKRGHCIKCGYDLSHAEHEVCPECGVAVVD